MSYILNICAVFGACVWLAGQIRLTVATHENSYAICCSRAGKQLLRPAAKRAAVICCRGRLESIDADRRATAALLDRSAETDETIVRVWTPARQLAFGRRDAQRDGYEEARTIAKSHGYLPIERSVGGRAVAYTGSVVAFAHVQPIEDIRRGMDDRYDAAVETVIAALERTGASVRSGEPDRSYCPGAHSIQGTGSVGKIAGIAQRVTAGAALVSGCVTVSAVDQESIADVLSPVYSALSVPFAPASVGSVEAAGGTDDPETVIRAIEQELAGTDPEIVDIAAVISET